MRGVFWILIGVVLVPPLSTLWLAPLGVLPHIAFHSPYLLGSLAIGIVFIVKGSLEIRKEKRENPRKF
jgi:hypothetical protein